MKPLKLRIEGFGAYQQAQEIIFEDVELFAITGPTGAGKSTLLDAITYALYKSTPRIGSTGLKELKHPSAESGKVELTFMVSEQCWRVVRVVGKENQNRLEYLQGGDWRTHSSSEKVKDLDLKLVEILGMDYETFTRAILLPQGQFDLFLRGSPKERRDTLIKLYGLESLRAMREKVGEKLKDFREKNARLQGELDSLAEVEEEKISLLREELQGLEAQEGGLARTAEDAEKNLRDLEKRFERFAELQSLRRRKTTWESQVAEVVKLAERIAQAEKAERIWPQIEAVQTAQREAQEAAQGLQQAQSGVEKLRANLEQSRQGYDPSQLDSLKNQLSQLPLLEAQEARLKRYGGGLELKHPQPLPFDEDRLDALREAERSFEEARKAQDKLSKAQTLSKQAQSEIKLLEDALKTLQEDLERLKLEGQKAKSEYDQLQIQLDQERLRQGVLAHRHALKPGEKCPLCEQTVQTLPPEVILGDFSAFEKEVKAAQERLETLRADFKLTQGRIKDTQENLPKAQKLHSERQVEESEAKAEIQRLEAKLSGLDSPEQAREERNQRLSGLAEEIRRATGGTSAKVFADGLRQKIAGLATHQTQIQTLETQVTEAERKLSALQEVSRERERSKERLEQSVNLLLKEANFETEATVKSARLAPEAVQALRKRQSEHEQEGNFVKKTLERLEAELGSQDPVTDAAVREQKAALVELKTSLDALKKQIGGKKSDLSRMQQQIGRKRELMKSKAELDQQTDLWEQLSADLKGDRFQDFLLEHYQAGLLSRASELIRELSQGRYLLRLEDGEYKVLDRWTETLRPVRTLSGGESFMASLSLALSLSEHLSRGRIGALFLDEGFGTLDAETLEQVACVLEALPTQGRLVGIVTHVEALAERLPARLMVEKSPAGSKVSWKE